MRRGSVGNPVLKTLAYDPSIKQMVQANFGDRRRQQGARASVDAGAKLHKPPVVAQYVKAIRIGIERRIAAGRGQGNDDHVIGMHRLPGDDAIARRETKGAMGYRIKSQHLLDNLPKQRAVAANSGQRIGMARQRDKGRADQRGGSGEALRQSSNSARRSGSSGDSWSAISQCVAALDAVSDGAAMSRSRFVMTI